MRQVARDDARPRAARIPAEERRQQIVDAAIEVFARMGYAGAGTADIAAAVGIGEPTIYRYFANKRELYVVAIQQAADEIDEQWRRIANAAPDPLVALQRIGVWYYQRMHERPELLVLRSRSFTEAPDAEASTMVRDQYRRVIRFVAELFEQAKAQGLVSNEADIETQTWLFMGIGLLLDLREMLGLEADLTPQVIARMAALAQLGGME